MVFVIFILMIIAIFRERPNQQKNLDDGMFLPIDTKELPILYTFDGGGVDLNSHNF